MSVRVIILTVLAAFPITFAVARDKTAGGDVLHVFGVATCLGDSSVYVSSLQELPGVFLDAKSDFLDNCHDYARQMETYLQAREGKHFTCAFFFATSSKKIVKKYAAVYKRLSKDTALRAAVLSDDEFRFRIVSEVPEEAVPVAESAGE